MRRLTGMEKVGLLLALLLVGGGLISVLKPSERAVWHPGWKYFVSYGSWSEFISKDAARVYGGIAVVVGVGIGFFVLYRGRND